MTVVLDASAIIALARDEPGADVVEAHLLEASTGPPPVAIVSTVNLTEVVQALGEPPSPLIDLGDEGEDSLVVPTAYTADDALLAATMREQTRSAGLSLADRACLALGRRTGLRVITADQAWATVDVDVEVLLIR